MSRLQNPLDGDHARHLQAEWERRAGDRRLPNWLRVASLAYGKHGNNGHANFKRGDVAVVLGEPGKPLDRRQVYEYIARAVELGWLLDGSTSMCLVVPPHVVDKGKLGQPKTRCRVHGRRAQASGSKPVTSSKASVREPVTSEQVTGSEPVTSRSAPISYPKPHLTAVPDSSETA